MDGLINIGNGLLALIAIVAIIAGILGAIKAGFQRRWGAAAGSLLVGLIVSGAATGYLAVNTQFFQGIANLIVDVVSGG